MENEKMPRDLMRALSDFFAKEMENDPECPAHLLAGLHAGQAVRDLHEMANGLIDALHEFVDVEDTETIREIEQYAKLVTEGIRQYLASIGRDPGKGKA